MGRYNQRVPSDDIVGLFGHLVNDKLIFDFPQACYFFRDTNRDHFEDLFAYVYDCSKGYPFSNTVAEGLKRVSAFYSIGENYSSNVRIITPACKNFLKSGIFTRQELVDLKNASELFREKFSA